MQKSAYNANISDYKTISILGHCFNNKAVVHLAKHLPSGEMVAIKKFNMDRIKEDINLVEVLNFNNHDNALNNTIYRAKSF